MKILTALLFAILLSISSALAASEVDGTVAIAAGANTITLSSTKQFSHVIVWLSTGSSTIYCTVNHGVTASSSNALIGSGSTVAYGLSGRPIDPTDQINYFGNGTTGTISYVAW